MEDPIFDAIFILCDAADADGFTSVADALELVLDLYLLERDQMHPPHLMFRSKRAQQQRELAAWVADNAADCDRYYKNRILQPKSKNRQNAKMRRRKLSIAARLQKKGSQAS